MNLNYVITFLNLVKMGSFSKAARKCNFSQSNVSYQIKKLEQEIGLPLIDHKHKKIVLTEAGKILLGIAENIHKEESLLEKSLSQLKDNLSGTLHLITSHTIGEFVLPGILTDFKEKYPFIELEITSSNSSNAAEVFDEVKNGLFELGFSTYVHPDNAVSYFKIAADEIVLIVYPGHRLSHVQEVSFNDLVDENFVLRSRPLMKSQSISNVLLKNGFDIAKCKVNLSLDTNIGVIAAVEARAGIAFMSSLAVQKSSSLGSIKVIKIKDVTMKRDHYCIHRKIATLPRIYQEFVAFLKNHH